MEVFFKDKHKLFECNIKLEGANIDDTSARLILEFDGSTLLFKGSIDKYGKCTIDVPALKNMKNINSAVATLEVIAESTLFTPWTSECIIKESKSVNVELIDEKTNTDYEEPPVKINVQILKTENNITNTESTKEEITQNVEELVTNIDNNVEKHTKQIIKEDTESVYDFDAFLNLKK